MEITRNYVAFPDVVKAVICGDVPTDERWDRELAATTFGEIEWMAELGVKEKGLRKIIDQHRLRVPSTITVEKGEIQYELRCQWNSVEEIWREKGSDCGPFIGGSIFTPECQVVFYWDIRLHNGRRSYPIPICFNTTLLKRQWSIYRNSTKAEIRRRVALKKWGGTPLVMPGPPNTEENVRNEFLRFYGFGTTDSPGDRMILVTTLIVTVRTAYAKFQVATWCRAELISDANQLYAFPRTKNANTKINRGAKKLNNQVAQKVFQW